MAVQPRGTMPRGAQPRGTQPRGDDTDEATLDPLLAAAVGLWRFASIDAGWTTADGWTNEGTAGAALDLVAANEGSGTLATSPVVTAGADNRVTPTRAETGIHIGHALGDADNGGADYGFFTDGATFDLSGSFTIALDFTPDAIGVASQRYLWQGGPFSKDGWLIEEAVASGGFIFYVGDEATFVYSPPTFAGFAADIGTAVAGRQNYTAVIDRDAGVLRTYRDGAALTVEVAGTLGAGDCSAAWPLIVGPGQTVHNIGFYTTALSAGDVADFVDLLEV